VVSGSSGSWLKNRANDAPLSGTEQPLCPRYQQKGDTVSETFVRRAPSRAATTLPFARAEAAVFRSFELLYWSPLAWRVMEISQALWQ
jgi:hypothetical protein